MEELTNKPLGTDKDGQLQITWPHEVFKQEFAFATSLPNVTQEDRVGLLAIWESECLKGSTLIGAEFTIADYICGPCTMVDEGTGEETDGIRTLFISPDHPPIAFVAKAALEAIRKLSYARGCLPPWDPPVRVKLRQVSGRGARRTYKFIPVTKMD